MGSVNNNIDWDVVNVDLTTTYQEVKYTKNIRGFLVQSRGENDIKHKRRTGDTKYFTIKGGMGVPYTVAVRPKDASTTSLGFFATIAGTETAEIIVFI